MNRKVTQSKNLCWWAFFLAIIIGAITLAPIVIADNGYFTYYGDFCAQEIPFNIHLHEMVRSGQLGWDWNTDLGANILGSYSFYTIFSPFFWLTLLLPSEAIPFTFAPLLVLKFAFASFTSYFWLSRFTKDKRFAVLGGLLYAFSGFSIYNLFFFHFHECIVFFPLILLGIELLLTENKHLPLILAVTINAVVNYWFFIGEVVFTIIYFCVRISSPEFSQKLKKFLFVAIDSLLGVLIAAVTLIPAVLAVMGNPRTAFPENLLNGLDLWVYSYETTIPAIIANFFLPSDLPSVNSMFYDKNHIFSSVAGWLPLFGMSGVIAYVRARKKDWLSTMIIVCTVFALVPILNSSFALFNDMYYCRWFYMFDLILALATVLSIEHMPKEDAQHIDFKKGLIPASVVSILLILILAFTPTYLRKKDEWEIGLTKGSHIFIAGAILGVICIALTFIIWKIQNNKNFFRYTLVLTALVCAVYGAVFLKFGYNENDEHKELISCLKKTQVDVILPEMKDEENFARFDFYECLSNINMVWELPSIQCFHSVVPVSIMEFYPKAIGVERTVRSNPMQEDYELRSLLSVKWLYIEKDLDGGDPMPGYSLIKKKAGFKIFENDNYIPMGFTYDSYISENDFYDIKVENRSQALLSAIVLPESVANRYSDYLPEYKNIESIERDFEQYEKNVKKLNKNASNLFKASSYGFICEIDLDKDNLVFFSVPYDRGWTAYVNGVETAIEKVNVGFMAVLAPKGSNTIEFKYETPGLKIGMIISISALVITTAYMIILKKKKNNSDIIVNVKQENKKINEIEVDDTPIEEDLTIIRKPEDVPKIEGGEEIKAKIYPEL